MTNEIAVQESVGELCAFDFAVLDMTKNMLDNPDVDVQIGPGRIRLYIYSCGNCKEAVRAELTIPREHAMFPQISRLVSSWSTKQLGAGV